jgi:Mus7/MMS22 family
LLFGEDLGAILGLCARTTALDSVEISNMEAFNDEVIEVILSTVTSYIVNWLPKAEDLRGPADKLHLLLKTVVSTQLGRYQQCSDEILRSLAYCWHALAKVSVDRGIRSWDSYLSLGGRDAWQSFDDTWHKSQYEVYFAALFLESNKDVWREWQVPMLQLWIASLLVPEARFKYQAELTTQIMRYDASCNPLLFHLPLVLYEDKVLVKVHLDELIAARTALILALLRNMNKSTIRPDSQDCFFGPSEDECCSILKMMMALMRQYLEELEQEPAEQEIYADFVGRVLSEMRIYTTHLEPVPEEFEYIPGKFLPAAPGTIKAKLSLYRQLMVENGMEKHMIVFLHTAAERAAITGQQEAFENQLVGVFLDLTTESLEDAQGYAADAHFRALFFQNVFPAYLDRIFYGSGFIVARPVLGCILSVYQGLRFRFGLWTREFLEPFITATLSLLSTLKTTLAGSIISPEHILTEPSQLSAYSFLCSIMSEILCRCQEMEDSFGTFSELSDIWEYFLFFYKYTLMVAFRPPRALPEELLDDNDQTELLEPKLSASDDAMLAYARRELGDILDSKWVPSIDGTWFVKRAGGRKEQVHGVVVGSPEQEMCRMQAAAERYVRVFAAAWNA